MAELSGTLVASRIVPSDTLDAYATHDAEYGRDGHRSCATIAERDAITDQRRKEGMTVWVQSEQKEYRLIGGILNANWQEVTGGSSYQSAGIDFSSYEEVTALENDDFMLISRGGSLKKIKVSNARDYFNPPSDAVMVGDDFVVANGQYVVVQQDKK